jgi:hypothetical protein
LIVKTIGDWLRERSARRFVVPCMGSRAGATAGGQKALVESLGMGVHAGSALNNTLCVLPSRSSCITRADATCLRRGFGRQAKSVPPPGKPRALRGRWRATLATRSTDRPQRGRLQWWPETCRIRTPRKCGTSEAKRTPDAPKAQATSSAACSVTHGRTRPCDPGALADCLSSHHGGKRARSVVEPSGGK